MVFFLIQPLLEADDAWLFSINLIGIGMSSQHEKTKFKSFFSQNSVYHFILKWTLIGLIIGSCIGCASAFFLYTLNWVTDFRESNLWLVGFLPVCGFLVGLIYHYYGKDVEAGNNLLIDTIHNPEAKIPFKMAPLVYLGTIATHFFGGSAGREGTALQMAGAIADQFSKPFNLTDDDRRILIISAVAGGFGSVFGTPLAGTFFALEFFKIGKINTKSIYPAFITAVFADVITKLWKVPHTHYIISLVPEMTFVNLMLTIVVGICFGFCAMLFSLSLKNIGKLFKSKVKYGPLRPLIGGIIVASVVFIMGTSKYIGLGIPTIVDSFSHQADFYDFAFKLLFTVITLSAGFKGGEVTPLFFIGATLGSALSFFIPLPTGLLAGMGFVAVFAGATNTPIACSIMALELFGIDCGVYAAIACVVSYLISGHSSIYVRQMVGEPKHSNLSKDKGKRLNEL